LHVRWKTAEAYLLCPGSQMPVERAVFLGNSSSADQDALAQTRLINRVVP